MLTLGGAPYCPGVRRVSAADERGVSAALGQLGQDVVGRIEMCERGLGSTKKVLPLSHLI